jgi:hypothetical protein
MKKRETGVPAQTFATVAVAGLVALRIDTCYHDHQRRSMSPSEMTAADRRNVTAARAEDGRAKAADLGPVALTPTAPPLNSELVWMYFIWDRDIPTCSFNLLSFCSPIKRDQAVVLLHLRRATVRPLHGYLRMGMSEHLALPNTLHCSLYAAARQRTARHARIAASRFQGSPLEQILRRLALGFV